MLPYWNAISQVFWHGAPSSYIFTVDNWYTDPIPWTNISMLSTKQGSTRYHFKIRAFNLRPPAAHLVSALPLDHWVLSEWVVSHSYSHVYSRKCVGHDSPCLLVTRPVSAPDWLHKSSAMCFIVFVIMHAKDLQLYVVTVLHCFPVADKYQTKFRFMLRILLKIQNFACFHFYKNQKKGKPIIN